MLPYLCTSYAHCGHCIVRAVSGQHLWDLYIYFGDDLVIFCGLPPLWREFCLPKGGHSVLEGCKVLHSLSPTPVMVTLSTLCPTWCQTISSSLRSVLRPNSVDGITHTAARPFFHLVFTPVDRVPNVMFLAASPPHSLGSRVQLPYTSTLERLGCS